MSEVRPLMSIDPGVRGLGVAIWDSQMRLAKACYVKGAPDTVPAGPDAWRALLDALGVTDDRFAALELAIEFPQIYLVRRTPPKDLLQLAAVVGSISAFPAKVTTYLPREWKGQVPKLVMIDRIKARLSPEERALVELPRGAKEQTDVWDGVGIGLAHLGRL